MSISGQTSFFRLSKAVVALFLQVYLFASPSTENGEVPPTGVFMLCYTSFVVARVYLSSCWTSRRTDWERVLGTVLPGTWHTAGWADAVR